MVSNSSRILPQLLRSRRHRQLKPGPFCCLSFPSAPILPTLVVTCPHGSWARSCDPTPPRPTLLSCSSINVTLGAHNIKKQEKTQQIIPVRRAIPHPDYNPKNYSNDIMLLQVRRPPHCPRSPGSTLSPLPLGPVPSFIPGLAT